MLSQAIQARYSLPILPLQAIETNWAVITGVFSSGKTTLLEDVRAARPELPAMPDAAREVISTGTSWRGPKGESVGLESILRTRAFQDTVFSLKWERHCESDPATTTLLDYGLPDVIAFSAACGLRTDPYESRAGLFRYRWVFLLEPLPYVEDAARKWDEDERLRIFHGIKGSYERFGFSPIVVPAYSREERRDFVLAHMGLG